MCVTTARPWNSNYCMLSYLTFDHIGPLDTGTNNVYIINLFCMHVFSSVQFWSVFCVSCELFQAVRKLFSVQSSWR